MKKISILTTLLIAFGICNLSAQNKLKRYDVKSGIVEYTTTISGKVMGSTINGSGTSNLYFKDWGAVELNEEKSSQTTSIKFFGKKTTETENTHSMAKLDNGNSFYVDFENEKIIGGRDAAMELTKAFYPNADAGEAGENMAESIGGKKVGTEKFMGHTCDIWEIAGGRQWNYKGVMLKMELTMLGISTITQATTAKFDVSVPNSHFSLPNFPIEYEEGFMDDDEYEEDMEDMEEKMETMSKMSFSEWKKLVQKNDKEMQEMSDEELRQTYDMMQKMIKMRQGK
jgi:hypothetical protein